MILTGESLYERARDASGARSDELNSEGECPGCIDEREQEESGDA